MSVCTPVVIKQLPEQLTSGKIQSFVREIVPLFQANRPRLVFDFSQVRKMDSTAVEMLLYCMEEAMKRNGDLKFAAVPPSSAIILELTRVDQLFEIFETVADAVDSYSGLPRGIGPGVPYDGSARSEAGAELDAGATAKTNISPTADDPGSTAHW